MGDFGTMQAGKTPISMLQEICTKQKLTPAYDVLANEGPVHEPVFVMRVQVGELKGIGRGSSKKKAKHNAAQQLLSVFYGIKDEEDVSSVKPAYYSVPVVPFPPPPSLGGQKCSPIPLQGSASLPNLNTLQRPTPAPRIAVNRESDTFDEDMEGNPIGEIQEYTQKNLLRPPTYEFISEQGPPHAREFVCVVKLGKLHETAVGKSKKIAKRAAAAKLLQAVRQQTTASPSAVIDDEEEDALPILSVLDTKSIHVQSEAGDKATKFYKTRQQSNDGRNNLLSAFHTMSLTDQQEDFIHVLANLSKEQKFEVRYLDIKELAYSGQRQCLVQLSTSPIAVCYGVGLTSHDARMDGAHHALQYLRLVNLSS